MKKAHFLLLFSVGVLFVPRAAFAIDYTAKRNIDVSTSDVAKKEESKEKENCSKMDLMQIDKFNEKAARKQKKYEELMLNRPRVDKNLQEEMRKNERVSMSKAKALAREVEENEKEFKKFQHEQELIESFFDSEDYKKMKPVYLRCDREMPELKLNILF